MTYDWQMKEHFTSRLIEGQPVKLNERWSGYEYLRREFGSMFPCGVKSVHGDIIELSNKTRFARQCLQSTREK